MVRNDLYPLKFASIYKKTLWGGNRLGTLFGKDVPPGGCVGEAWEVADHGDDNSIVINGIYKDMRLRQLMDDAKVNDLLGRGCNTTGGNRFPLLVKLIDTSERLSLQVHPGDSYVMANEPPGESGKMEAWYIIHADPGAWIIRGLRPGITRENLERSLKDDSLEDCLNFLSVSPGDVIFIPPGTLHAIGPGIVLLEVQQNSDITYRLCDWGRDRELNVQKALEVINFAPPAEHRQDKTQPVLLSPPPKKRELLLECEKFMLESLELADEECGMDDMPVFHILTVIEGSGTIVYGESGRLDVSAGESVLVPAALKRYKLCPHGRCRIIKTAPAVVVQEVIS
ncbi:MAG: class I mannose-6-phosphate isomerase [Candidatus Brocadiales bacterium]|nr:class I mannose-6-phosphate isomerase [Candidatus Bathyanammoxibius sp.]